MTAEIHNLETKLTDSGRDMGRMADALAIKTAFSVATPSDPRVICLRTT
ncbi:hypothetical protein HZF05_15635 [Sphingomonas sp. CGMCC 1.13654]|uniref:Uncharacterized protein n=1 Tax=Sphingomonas chungangi TaxID=2683589 RepID=A0A838LDE4_9SPHN|nr:hypothetical protein [Sphingomonas chungangi]MBA2935518.1 hypothetical protein [Sphingomonas chungangi]MVW57025.1 hypothetical protein [Sphingomonas chungangi]